MEWRNSDFFGWERKTSVAFSKLRINTHQWKKNLSSVIAFIPPRLKEYQDKDLDRDDGRYSPEVSEILSGLFQEQWAEKVKIDFQH